MTERFRQLTGEVADEAATLLRSCRTLQMATASADGVPEASYAPFVRTDDGAFHICVSDLSRHTGHLVATGRASVLVIEDESRTTQFFTRRRLAFECTAEQIDRDSLHWRTVMDVLEGKFGEVIGLIRPARGLPAVRPAPQSRHVRQGLRTGISNRGRRARSAPRRERSPTRRGERGRFIAHTMTRCTHRAIPHRAVRGANLVGPTGETDRDAIGGATPWAQRRVGRGQPRERRPPDVIRHAGTRGR